MKSQAISLAAALAGSFFISSAVLADAPKVEFPAASPSCSIKQRVGLTDITVDYSRPSVKDRQIFGGMIPYGQVWRTGANAATKIVFSTAVKLNGTEIPAGTYALMTIPGKDEWTVIINKGSEQWGAYKYDEKADVARIKVAPVAIDMQVDTFTIEFNKIRDESSLINLAWDKTVVPIKLEVDYEAKLEKQIEEVMASSDAKKPYFQSALFFYTHNKDLQKASKWIDQALAERPDAHFMLYVKAEILAKLGDKAGALKAAQSSKEFSQKANDSGYVKLNEDLIKTLQ